MAKKEFKSGIQKPTDEQIFNATKGIPFGTCKQCGLRTVTSQVLCPECERLTEIGFGPVPRAFNTPPGQDTAPVQSFPSDNHSGYKETNVYGKGPQPSKKFPPNKERM